jgi:hypothetical protein
MSALASTIRFTTFFLCAAALGAAEIDGPTYIANEKAAYAAGHFPDGPTVKRFAPPKIIWSDTAKAPGYDAATAMDPQYANKVLWPQLVGKEAYVGETWPKTRVLTWAKPGVNGSKDGNTRDQSISVIDPANWLEDGKPATELWDEDTDLVIPAADHPYTVNTQDCGKRQEHRHITIGRNATLWGGGDGVGRQISGNIWVKSGGHMGTQGATSLVGGKHTFFRNDVEPKQDSCCSQYFAFNREKASLEMLGRICTSDEFMMNSGTIIIGPDTIVQAGRCCTPYIDKGAAMVLMDNAYFGCWANTWCTPDLTVKGGTLQAGLPERPLTRSAVVGLSFKNHREAKKVPEGQLGIWFDCARVSSLLLQEGSVVRSYAAPNSHASLVLREAGYFTICSETGIARIFPWDGMYDWCRGKWPDGWKNDQWFDQYPKGVDLLAFPGVTMTGVQLSGFRDGGVLVTDAKTATAWKDVTVLPPTDSKAAPAPVKPVVVTTAKPNGSY